MTKEYEVGYGKPPQHTKFKKGISGNPKGRPRGSKGANANIFCDLLAKKTTVSENGKRTKISLMEAYFWKLLMDAVHGKPHAVKLVHSLIEKNQHLQENFNQTRSPEQLAYEIVNKMIKDISSGPPQSIEDFRKSAGELKARREREAKEPDAENK
jgi:hypothetical protein